MTSSRPNVLFLTVDALRADRASVLGYTRPTTPNLDRMAADGLVCEQAVSPAAFTHICFPALMTSSRPLSYGGYDSGPVGGPATSEGTSGGLAGSGNSVMLITSISNTKGPAGCPGRGGRG